MATVKITARAKTPGGARAEVPSLMVAGSARATQDIISSASNQVSTVIAKAGETIIITSNGGAVKIAEAVGTNPDATSAYQDTVFNGGRLEYYCDQSDTRFAVVDV